MKKIILFSTIMLSSLVLYSQQLDSITDRRDNQTYKTVKIGNQIWMSENLNIGEMIQSRGPDDNQSDNKKIEKYCYNNRLPTCNKRGGLYQWDEIMQYKAHGDSTTKDICPSGWHIPTHNEWTILIDYLGGRKVAGGKMKATGKVHWKPVNEGASNTSGFNALPSGTRIMLTGSFAGISGTSNFWSATPKSASHAKLVFLEGSSAYIEGGEAGKAHGHPIRCLKD